jgi:hypothetical protein
LVLSKIKAFSSPLTVDSFSEYSLSMLIFFHEFIPSCFDQIKNVFWPNIFVGASFLILQSASGGPSGYNPQRL